ncbi:DNA primase [Rhodovibrio salinarum]|uniref:DNA primase n=1 Tax=Rhodovibrio salinarum TaxID=1087 RepID=A0A934V2W5_9PROT|nr:DNA primase [Rhodovibrio salinarum]MBK1698954.1 DNA primase [Rhodovibrio salinarum]
MAFPQEFLDRIRSMVPIADVVGRKVRLTKRGREHTGLCPFHNEKTPSFTVSEDKGFYHCFGCGAHGDVISFVVEQEGLSFPEAVEKLAAEAGLEVPKATPQERQREERRSSLYDVVEEACRWYEQQLAGKDGQAARDYLAGRGIDAETREAFRLGYAPGQRGALRQAMHARGIRDDQLVAAGLIKQPEDGGAPRDYLFDRVIFPITDRRGHVIAFGGRTMGEAKAKYLNSPESELFHKGRVLYNLARARRAARDTGELIVTEGYMDVIALAQAGFPAAVAPLGTAITEDQIAELWRLADEPVVCLDGDSAGRRAGYRLIDRALPQLKPGFSLRFALLPQGEDPDSLVSTQGPQAFRKIVDSGRPLAELLWMKQVEGRPLDTPERRAGLRQALMDDVKRIEQPDVAQAYKQDMLQRFDQAFGFQRSKGRNQRGGKGGGRWAPQGRERNLSPALGVRQPISQLQHRQEQALIATLVNHPATLLENAEELAEIALAYRDTDILRRRLLDLALERQELDTVEICSHLRQVPDGTQLETALSREVYRLWPFADPGASVQDARQGLRHLLNLYRDRSAKDEAVEEGRRLAESMNQESLARLEAKRKAAYENDSRAVDLDLDRDNGPWPGPDGSS